MRSNAARVGLDVISDPAKLELATMLYDIVIGSTLSLLGERTGTATIDIFMHLTLSLHGNSVWKANAVVLTNILSVIGRNYSVVTRYLRSHQPDNNADAIVTGTCTANVWLYIAMLDVFLSADEVQKIASDVWVEFGVIT